MMKQPFTTKYFFTIIILIALEIVGIQSVFAEIKLPAIVSSNMVLQRNTTIEIWGWAAADEKIKIKFSWLEKPEEIITDKQGNWKIEVKTTNSKAAQTITLKSETSNIVLENILFGEVWLCSGQSNMQQPIKGYNGQPTFGALQAIVNSKNPNLRLFTVGRKASKTPLNKLIKHISWQEAAPNTVSDFSAVAYFFGQQLQKTLDVPVGLIHSSWGGSKIEAWMSKESLSTYRKVDLTTIDITEKPNQKPTLLFNSMINPLIPYTIKGALWYQGESNRNAPEMYKKLFPAMVKDWRSKWNIGDFPFYYVQISPFLYGNNNAVKKGENSAFIREAQMQCLDKIPNAGIAITLDIGDQFFIHPPKKKEVADRLLFNALNKTYGYKAIDAEAPVYDSFEIKGQNIKLNFKNVKMGLFTYNTLNDFEIAGPDKVFYPATAKIVKRNQVLVKSDKVKNPVAVRYAWKNWVKASLFGTNLLPVSSFRTDTWNAATKDQ